MHNAVSDPLGAITENYMPNLDAIHIKLALLTARPKSIAFSQLMLIIKSNGSVRVINWPVPK